MKMRRFAASGVLVFGLFSTYALSGAPKVPPQQRSKTPAASAAASSEEQISPEERQKRKDWALFMHKKAPPKKGCFKADYPNTDWEVTPCAPMRNIPMFPRHGPRPNTVGNTNDISAQAPSGTISQAFGHFENITNVTSESGPINGAGAAVANAYTLQLNTNFMNSNLCNGSPNPNCQGWEQFVFENDGGTGNGSAYIQYWIIAYNKNCPPNQNWNQRALFGGTYCFKNNSVGGVAVPNQAITNMANWLFSGAASSTSDSVTMSVGTTAYARTGDNIVGASAGWTSAEFNIFGDGGSGMASFNAGASANARTEIIYGDSKAPTCLAQGTTGETNNLTFGPAAPAATAPGPAVIFQESIAGGATSNCAAASTIGDTHLHTFNGLFYDFQAAGDFTLAEVGKDFTVQTRQVSGAPTWPNATVNKAVAARFGKTQVAVCLAPAGRDEAAGIYVNGTLTPMPDGTTLELPEEAGIARQGNVYQLTSQSGNSVRATVNPTWIDVSVGLGQWPITVRGLIANSNGNLNQIVARDGFVLTNPFNFNDLYHRFADSWRVSAETSMLSVCNGGKPIEVRIPEQTFYAKNLEPAIREKAQGVCTTAGVKEGPLFEACTLDVAVIGNDLAAKVFVTELPPASVGTIIGGGGGILAKWWWLLLLLLLLILILWFLLRKKP